MGQVRQQNGVKPPETRVLDIKYVVRIQTDVVEHQNGVKLPQIWVLDQKECIKIFQVVCLEFYYSKTFNQMHTDTSFGPKVVDWACSLLENKKQFWRQKLVH